MAETLSHHPGPQKLLRRCWLGPTSLWLLVAGAGFLAVHSLLKENAVQLTWPVPWFWSLKLLDANTSITLFVGLLGVLVVRQQLAYGLRPYLIYECCRADESISGLDSRKGQQYWIVFVKNIGAGLALIRSAKYRLKCDGRAAGGGNYNHSNEQVVEILKASGFSFGREYVLPFFSEGSDFGSQEQKWVFEILMDKACAITALDVRFEFSGLLGDQYVKEIFCIPRLGLQHYFKNAEPTQSHKTDGTALDRK